MAKEQPLGLMEKSMLENTRMGKGMVKEKKLIIMEIIMKGNGRMVKLGTEQDTTKTKISYTMWMENR